MLRCTLMPVSASSANVEGYHEQYRRTQPTVQLNDHVLLEIFTDVVYLDLPRILSYTDVLSISQVCSSWRRLVLESAILWTGINLDVFKQKSQDWQREVMRRTKRAPLLLFGNFGRFSKSEDIYLLVSLLRCEWSRIQILDLAISPSLLDRRGINVEELGRLFNRPAPSLTSFSFRIYHYDFGEPPQLNGPPVPIIFCGEAPLLTKFTSRQFYLGLEGCRNLTSLSRLVISFPNSALQLLRLLENIPSLTEISLEADHDMSSTTTSLLPRVTPPNLLSITIKFYRGSFMPFVYILDHIQPVRRLTLELICRVRRPDNLLPQDISEIETFQRVLKTFSTSAFTNMIQDPLFTSIKIYNHTFEVATYCSDTEREKRPHEALFTFSVHILSEYRSLSNADLSRFVNLFASCDLSVIKELDLRSSLPVDLSADDPRQLFYEKLDSIECLTMDSSTLALFCDVNLSSVFPGLSEFAIPWDMGIKDRPALLSFMKNWISSASMTRILHLEYAAETQLDFSFLEEVPELCVTWNNGGNYVCGTGHQETIDFSYRHHRQEGVERQTDSERICP